MLGVFWKTYASGMRNNRHAKSTQVSRLGGQAITWQPSEERPTPHLHRPGDMRQSELRRWHVPGRAASISPCFDTVHQSQPQRRMV